MRKLFVFFLVCLLGCTQASGLELKSPGFGEGEMMPGKYVLEGENLSPELSWSGVPEGTKSFALIMDDPDAPRGTWVHWVIYDIPADATSLPEGVPREYKLEGGAKQGVNSFKWIGYGGPLPPPGSRHRYVFKLYALDRMLNLPPGASKAVLEMRMKRHILASAQLIGVFQR